MGKRLLATVKKFWPELETTSCPFFSSCYSFSIEASMTGLSVWGVPG